MKLKLFFILFLTNFIVIGQISQSERDALIEIYNSTGGSNWTQNTNWDTNPNATSDVSTWYGVTVENISGQDHVTKIELSNNNLNGTLPDLSNLISITDIDISKNSGITGAINVNTSSSLLNFFVNETSIDGLTLNHDLNINIKNNPNLHCVNIPVGSQNYYDQLSMDNFDLGVVIANNCAGNPVLDPLEKTALQAIYDSTNGDLWSNRIYASTKITDNVDLKGYETENFAGTLKIVKLYFVGMNLDGEIPSDIQNFTELQELNLSSNRIRELPDEMGNLSKLTHLILDSNTTLTTLPPTVGQLNLLSYLTFNRTGIDLLPTTINTLLNLETLEFGNTKITLLPPEIGSLSSLKRLVAAPNDIASIPTELGQLTQLTYLDFSNCELSNTPTAFANLTELETLYLNNNELQVVAGLGGFVKLKNLRLHNNRLGEDNIDFNTNLPSDIGDLVLLEELTLNNNLLTELPATIGNLNKLTVLPLQRNRLSSLPTTIGGLTNLTELRLEGNSNYSLTRIFWKP